MIPAIARSSLIAQNVSIRMGELLLMEHDIRELILKPILILWMCLTLEIIKTIFNKMSPYEVLVQ